MRGCLALLACWRACFFVGVCVCACVWVAATRARQQQCGCCLLVGSLLACWFVCLLVCFCARKANSNARKERRVCDRLHFERQPGGLQTQRESVRPSGRLLWHRANRLGSDRVQLSICEIQSSRSKKKQGCWVHKANGLACKLPYKKRRKLARTRDPTLFG